MRNVMSTPRGPAESREQVARSQAGPVWWVTTASHGGLMVPRLADDVMSAEARAIGQEWGGHVFFEDVTAWAVVVFENPAWQQPGGFFEPTAVNPIDARRVFEIVSQWFPDYLRARGLEPDPVAEARYRQMMQDIDAWQQETRARNAAGGRVSA